MAEAVAPVPLGCDTPMVTLQPQSISACEGQSINFEMEVEGTGLTFQWYLDTLEYNDEGPDLSIPSVSLSDSGAFYCVITGTCGQTTSDTVFLSITEPTPIVFNDTLPDVVVCEDSMVVFALSAAGADSYEWFNNGLSLNVFDTVYNLASVAITDGGAIWLEASNACTTAYSLSFDLAVLLNLTLLSGPSDMILDTTTNTTLAIDYVGEVDSVRWYRADTVVSTNDSVAIQNFQPADTGYYHYAVFGPCGFISDSVWLAIEGADGLSEQNLHNNLRLWPNPTSGRFEIQLPDDALYITVWDALGRPVAMEFTNGKPQIDMELEHAGVYQVTVVSRSAKYHSRLVVSHR